MLTVSFSFTLHFMDAFIAAFSLACSNSEKCTAIVVKLVYNGQTDRQLLNKDRYEIVFEHVTVTIQKYYIHIFQISCSRWLSLHEMMLIHKTARFWLVRRWGPGQSQKIRSFSIVSSLPISICFPVTSETSGQEPGCRAQVQTGDSWGRGRRVWHSQQVHDEAGSRRGLCHWPSQWPLLSASLDPGGGWGQASGPFSEANEGCPPTQGDLVTRQCHQVWTIR